MFDISREWYAKCWNFLVRLVFSLRCALVSRSNHTGSFREYATEGVFTWENSHRRGFHTGMTFWFRIAFTWWRGYFISRLFERTVHLYKIQVRFKIANITHTLPVLVHLQLTPADRFNIETGGGFALNMIPLRNFVPECNSRSDTKTGVTRASITFCGGIMF